jgi:hypothetical protein
VSDVATRLSTALADRYRKDRGTVPVVAAGVRIVVMQNWLERFRQGLGGD